MASRQYALSVAKEKEITDKEEAEEDCPKESQTQPTSTKLECKAQGEMNAKLLRALLFVCIWIYNTAYLYFHDCLTSTRSEK